MIVKLSFDDWLKTDDGYTALKWYADRDVASNAVKLARAAWEAALAQQAQPKPDDNCVVIDSDGVERCVTCLLPMDRDAQQAQPDASEPRSRLVTCAVIHFQLLRGGVEDTQARVLAKKIADALHVSDDQQAQRKASGYCSAHQYPNQGERDYDPSCAICWPQEAQPTHPPGWYTEKCPQCNGRGTIVRRDAP